MSERVFEDHFRKMPRTPYGVVQYDDDDGFTVGVTLSNLQLDGCTFTSALQGGGTLTLARSTQSWSSGVPWQSNCNYWEVTTPGAGATTLTEESPYISGQFMICRIHGTGGTATVTYPSWSWQTDIPTSIGASDDIVIYLAQTGAGASSASDISAWCISVAPRLSSDHTWTGFNTYEGRSRFDAGFKFTEDARTLSLNAFNVDFESSYYQTVDISGATGNVTCSASSNLGGGKRVNLYLKGGNREVSWPAGWSWLGPQLTEVLTGQYYHVILTSDTSADSGVLAQWVNAIEPQWQGTLTSGNLALGTSATDIAVAEDFTVPGYFSYSSPDLTVSKDGHYEGVYSALCTDVNGSNREPELKFQVDDGGGYADLASTTRRTFLRQATGSLEDGSLHMTRRFNLDAGDTIKLVGLVYSGSSNDIEVVDDQCHFSLTWKGPKR